MVEVSGCNLPKKAPPFIHYVILLQIEVKIRQISTMGHFIINIPNLFIIILNYKIGLLQSETNGLQIWHKYGPKFKNNAI